MSVIDNMKLPSPKWFRITKKLVSNTINFVMGILLITGHTDSSLIMLIIKLSQSFIMDQFDTFSANGEVYAPNTNYKLPDTETTKS